jgi:hypothetical protein
MLTIEPPPFVFMPVPGLAGPELWRAHVGIEQEAHSLHAVRHRPEQSTRGPLQRGEDESRLHTLDYEVYFHTLPGRL